MIKKTGLTIGLLIVLVIALGCDGKKEEEVVPEEKAAVAPTPAPEPAAATAEEPPAAVPPASLPAPAAEDTFYKDGDSDGYGNPNETKTSTETTAPQGYVADNTDCNDGDGTVNPASKIAENTDPTRDFNCDGIYSWIARKKISKKPVVTRLPVASERIEMENKPLVVHEWDDTTKRFKIRAHSGETEATPVLATTRREIAFNNGGQVAEFVHPISKTLPRYNEAGRLDGFSVYTGDQLTGKTNYTYDTVGDLLTGIAYKLSSSTGLLQPEGSFSFHYLDMKRTVLFEKYRGDLGTGTLVEKWEYSCNEQGQPKLALRRIPSDPNDMYFTLSYPDPLLATMERAHSGEKILTDWRFDASGNELHKRIRNWIASTSIWQLFYWIERGYDDQNRLTTLRVRSSSDPSIPADGPFTVWKYDEQGNIVEGRSFVGSESGSLLYTEKFSYDPEGRLVTYKAVTGVEPAETLFYEEQFSDWIAVRTPVRIFREKDYPTASRQRRLVALDWVRFPPTVKTPLDLRRCRSELEGL